ncbi:cyclic peptide export ABC transporter [Nitrospirillum pindoramense]|uniref:Putative ATP-binding cassette transporter n=1 Tax=Nitrospirillum amazonense TaxID=28077 RepID=A0A560GT98_9PROT|nr:cyclic peptide export ABC transporter [Nitrospirillum amazonense]TWB37262.1 putative ATP-binding cassette transporter [Nitrospirillum amazonense]
MRMWRLVVEEIPQNLRSLAWTAALSALASTTLMWLVDEASQQAAKGSVSERLVLLFALSITLFAVSDNYVLVTASQDAENIIHRLRTRLFDAVRASDLVSVERLGRTRLYSALTQDTQTLARSLPFLVIGVQQAIVLVFLGVYLAWLSVAAFVMAFGFAIVAVAVRYARMKALGQAMRDAVAAEMAVFDGLSDMLDGFKEVRMSTTRAEGLVADVGAASAEARRIKSRTKAQWGWEFALLQAMFYTLIGLMVFLVPLVAKDYADVVVPATMTALFVVGPVGTLAHVTPMVTETEMALANMDDITSQLRRAVELRAGESALPLSAPRHIALQDAVFSYADSKGRPLFSVGPLTLSFQAGEITFVTGGNGSGKSTMLRLLTGLAPLSGGQMLADGVPVAPGQMQAYRDHFSAIFADHHLSRRLYGVGAIDPLRVEALLERLEMTGKVHVADGAFSTIDLSTGQRKRLALLVAELEDKPILVFDEWAADQDPHFRHVFYEELLPAFKARGKIVICVTHDDRWFGMADRIYHMNEGQVMEQRSSVTAAMELQS